VSISARKWATRSVDLSWPNTRNGGSKVGMLGGEGVEVAAADALGHGILSAACNH
jgi:hypothetical protein